MYTLLEASKVTSFIFCHCCYYFICINFILCIFCITKFNICKQFISSDILNLVKTYPLIFLNSTHLPKLFVQ